jgi:hypothetical protein
MNRRLPQYFLALASAALIASGHVAIAADNPPADAAAPMATPPEAPLVVLVEDAPFRATLASAVAHPALGFRFAGDEGQREIAADELVVWGGFVEPAGGVQVVLVGGDVVVARDVRIEDERLVGTWSDSSPLEIPLALVAGIVFQRPADSAKSDQLLSRILSLSGQDDRVILDNGDELTGTISTLDGTKLRLQSQVGVLDLAQSKLAAVIFNPVLIDKPRLSGPRVLVGFRDGSRVTAMSAESDKQETKLKLPGGGDLNTPTDSIVALQPLGGRVTYLSDLEPSGYRHIPFLELSWPYHTDRSVQGSLLRAGGRLYLKGLGMHSPSRITYDLDQPYERFDTEVALDSEAGRRGSVVFRVFVDEGGGSWQERARSEIVRGGQPPAPLSVDLSGARRISLLVDFADHGDEQDHADWLNARLVR